MDDTSSRRATTTTSKPRFSSRLVQSLIALLGITITVHHFLLTSNQLYNVNALMSDVHEDHLLLQKRQLTEGDDNYSQRQVNLEWLSKHIGHSSQLLAKEKEQLLNTIQRVAQEKQQQQGLEQDAISTPAPAFELTPNSSYAYMFVMGGIDPDRPSYKGFLYDVLISARLLRQLGSTADVVLYTQMSTNSTVDQLPLSDLQLLEALNIQVLTLPKPKQESFAGLVFEKFRALQMTQYRRVIFLDADAIPLANLDYLFHLSDPLHTTTPTLLRPNLIMASRAEPCNAGLFMLQPEHGAWDELIEIIHRQRDEGSKLPYPHFDWNRGWGYDFEAENDRWRGTVKQGQKWKFHAGHSDQGLLYYWTKYHKRDVSIIIQDQVENWVDAGSNAKLTLDGKPKPMLQMTLLSEPLASYSQEQPLAFQFECDHSFILSKPRANRPHQCIVPYRDFAHFMGNNKPWMTYSPSYLLSRTIKTKSYEAATHLWFTKLGELNDELDMKLNFDKWHETHDIKETPLGKIAKYSDIVGDHGVLKKEKGANGEEAQK